MLDKLKKKKYIRKFLTTLWTRIIYPVNIIKATHQRTLEVNFDELPQIQSRNPYQVFRDWLLEIIGKGILVTYIYITLVGWSGWIKGIYLILTFGLMWYCGIRVIYEISSAIRK